MAQLDPIPFYLQSPSIFSLAFWTICSLYGTIHMSPQTLREWLGRFGDSAFMLGLIILPFDFFWQIGQWLRFGYLYPDENLMVTSVLIRDATGIALCYVLSRNLFAPKGPATIKGLRWLILPLATMTFLFTIAPDPGFMDPTYAMRFGSSVSWQFSYLKGVPDRCLQFLAYYKLWKPKVKT
jgi:hypothetical protein